MLLKSLKNQIHLRSDQIKSDTSEEKIFDKLDSFLRSLSVSTRQICPTMLEVSHPSLSLTARDADTDADADADADARYLV